VLKIFPKNDKFFNFFLFGSKKSLWVGSKSLLFTAGKKYAWVGLDQGPSLLEPQTLGHIRQTIAQHKGNCFNYWKDKKSRDDFGQKIGHLTKLRLGNF